MDDLDAMSPGLLASIGVGFLLFAAVVAVPLRRWRDARFALLAEQFEKLRHFAETDRAYVPPKVGALADAAAYDRARTRRWRCRLVRSTVSESTTVSVPMPAPAR